MLYINTGWYNTYITQTRYDYHWSKIIASFRFNKGRWHLSMKKLCEVYHLYMDIEFNERSVRRLACWLKSENVKNLKHSVNFENPEIFTSCFIKNAVFKFSDPLLSLYRNLRSTRENQAKTITTISGANNKTSGNNNDIKSSFNNKNTNVNWQQKLTSKPVAI